VTSRAATRDDAQACLRAYEALRNHVLTGAGSHAGLIVLLRQGVAAWMARRLACPCPAPGAARTTTLLLGEEIDLALVRVLASMALAASAEVHV
jgi:hypothetical protein